MATSTGKQWKRVTGPNLCPENAERAVRNKATLGNSQSDHPKLQKWACIFGLVSQPAWFYTSYIHHQWGVFIMSFFYTAAWGRGILTYWLNSREIVSD